LFIYKTKATRPRPRPELQDQDQDQDQTCTTKTKTKTAAYKTKTKTKTSFCWSETGLVTRPRSQTTSLLFTILNCYLKYLSIINSSLLTMKFISIILELSLTSIYISQLLLQDLDQWVTKPLYCGMNCLWL